MTEFQDVIYNVCKYVLKFFTHEIGVRAHLTQTRHAQKACAEMRIRMKNGWKRYIAACLATVTVISGMQGMSVKAAETGISGEIEVIFNRAESVMEPYIDKFEEKYPDVKVKYTCYNDYENELKPRFEEGNYGDVLYFPSYIATESVADYFEPLGTMEELSVKYNYLDQGRHYDGIVYAIPSSAYLIGIVYNKEVFDTAGITSLPTTIDEFLYAMYLIDENTNAIPFYAGYSEPWVLGSWEVFPFIEMSGKASYKFNEFITDVNPFREGTVHNQTLKLLYDLVEKGYTEVGTGTLGWWDSIIKMNNGEIGCSVIGTWALYDYKNVGPNGDDIGFMPFPNNIDGKQYVTVTGDYGYAISKNSKNKAAARAFLDFMLDESGYAFEHDTLSVLKTDPYPECYGDMEHTSVLNSANASGEAYTLFNALTTNIILYNTDEYVRIVEAAAGIRDESFEDIMDDWNMRWEAGREGIEIVLPEVEEKSEDKVILIGNEQVVLSDNEKAFIQKNETLTVGYNKNLAPISYEEDGEFLGVAKDICKMISAKSGLKMEYRGYENTRELVEALNNGKIDFVAGMDKLNSYNTLSYSKDYLQYVDVVVRHNTVEAASLKRYVGADGEKHAAYMEAEQTESCATIEETIRRVHKLEADFTITNFYSANYYMRKNDYDAVTVIPYAINQTYHIVFGENTDPALIAICNKCIYSLTEGETEIALMQYMDSVVQQVTVRNFVRSNPFTCIAVISGIFVLIFAVLFQRYNAHKKQALATKKYELLTFQADEYIFEYEYRRERFEFDDNFVGALEFESTVHKNAYDDGKAIVNQFLKHMEAPLEDAKDAQFTMALDDEDGNRQWYRVITFVIYSKKKHPTYMLGKLVNIQKEMEEIANYQNKAYRDALTQVYNRAGLLAHLPKEAKGVMLAVMDIDDFKKVNDTLGHGGGDYALMFFVDKLKQCMGSKALVARYGGDEFVVLLTDVTREEAKKALGELVRAMNVSIIYADNSRILSISAGAVYADVLESFDDMFEEADRILYQTKEDGKNNFDLKDFLR